MSGRRLAGSEPDPISNDRRRARRRHLFPPGTACGLCGETAPEALVEGGRDAIEAHHVSGETNDPGLMVALCRNCHAVVTERARDAEIDLRHRERDVLERQAGASLSDAVFLRALADAMEQRAAQLTALRDGLDRRYPKWHSLPEAWR